MLEVKPVSSWFHLSINAKGFFPQGKLPELWIIYKIYGWPMLVWCVKQLTIIMDKYCFAFQSWENLLIYIHSFCVGFSSSDTFSLCSVVSPYGNCVIQRYIILSPVFFWYNDFTVEWLATWNNNVKYNTPLLIRPDSVIYIRYHSYFSCIGFEKLVEWA